jgi:hypothetical protein
MAWVPSLLLVLTLAVIHLSGNDKAPALLLVPLLSSLLIGIILIIQLRDQDRWRRVIVAMLPWAYVVVVVLLARVGWIDSKVFLGFR